MGGGARVWRLANRTAPGTALVLLVAIVVLSRVYGLITPREIRGADDYFQRVREQIEEIPYYMSGWVGTDIPVQQASIELLHPNKLLERRYTQSGTGLQVTLLVVHCGDSRDMVGHWPPNCYPANGWVGLGAESAQAPLSDGEIEATRYSYERSDGDLTQRMNVFNFFVLPRYGVVPTKTELDRVSRASAVAALGAAQVQIMTDLDMSDEETEAATSEFVAALEPVIRTVAAGVRDAG